MNILTRRSLQLLESVSAPHILVLSTILATVHAYVNIRVGNGISTYYIYIYASCLGLVALMVTKKSGQRISQKLYLSRFNSSIFSLIGAAIFSISLTRHFSLWIELPAMLSKAYGYSADARPELYNLRSMLFDGSLEYSYLLLMGSFILPINLKYKKLTSWAIALCCIILIGLFELCTLSRFTSAPLMLTCAIATNSLILEYHHNNSPRFKIYATSTFLIFLLGASPIFLRSAIYKHLPSLASDAQTMSQGIEMRESSAGRVSGLSYKNGYDANKVSQVWKNHQANRFSIDDQKMLPDFICSTLAGPYLENRICSGYMHNWLKQSHSNYYLYSNGPVLSTSKYWEYGNNISKIIIAFNWAFLLLPFIAILSYSNWPATFLEAWLVSTPIFTIKLISFFRGDPMHAGINYFWIFTGCALIIYGVKKISTPSARSS